MDPFEEKLMNSNAECCDLIPVMQDRRSNLSECNRKGENLPTTNINVVENIMLSGDLTPIMKEQQNNSNENNQEMENLLSSNVNDAEAVTLNSHLIPVMEKQQNNSNECNRGTENLAIANVSGELNNSLSENVSAEEGTECHLRNNSEPEKTNKINEYRCESDSWSEDESSSSSSSDTSSDSEFFQVIVESSVPKKLPDVKTKGELGLNDLPPIEELTITVLEEEMKIIGKVHAVVDVLVVIRAMKDMQPLNIDSVLFLSHDKPLGRVFEIFGPVPEPFYSVRFNNANDIKEKQIELGADVFFAPDKNDITLYVCVADLQKEKGSDASWKHNNEPPEEFLDFSDDEEEKLARRRRMNKNRNRHHQIQPPSASKKPLLAGNSPSHSYYRPRNDSSPRRNPFSNLPPPPSPSFRNIMSAPIRTKSSNFISMNQPHLPLSHPQRPFSPQRSPSPLLLTSYQQPHVFGQVTLLSPVPSTFQSTSLLQAHNIPRLIPASSLTSATTENYLNPRFTTSAPNTSSFPSANYQNSYSQRFPRTSTGVPTNQRTTPDPWLPNASPNSMYVPPNQPLTVHIPNVNSPVPPNLFQSGNGPVQQSFVNNMNLYNNNVHRFGF